MANCKICGKPVLAGPVMHGECLDQLMTETAEKFCDDYCRWRVECVSNEKLHETYCDLCPVNELMKLTTQGGKA